MWVRCSIIFLFCGRLSTRVSGFASTRGRTGSVAGLLGLLFRWLRVLHSACVRGAISRFGLNKSHACPLHVYFSVIRQRYLGLPLGLVALAVLVEGPGEASPVLLFRAAGISSLLNQNKRDNSTPRVRFGCCEQSAGPWRSAV